MKDIQQDRKFRRLVLEGDLIVIGDLIVANGHLAFVPPRTGWFPGTVAVLGGAKIWLLVDQRVAKRNDYVPAIPLTDVSRLHAAH